MIGVLGVPEVLPNQFRVDPLMDVVTQVHTHGAKAKEVLEGAGSVLSEVFGQLFPERPVSPSVPELVQSFMAEKDLFGEYYKMQTKAGAKTSITFALASG